MDLKNLKCISKDNSPFYLVYIYFYNKKEAIDSLLKKVDGDINKFEKLLKGKLDLLIEALLLKISMILLIV